MKNIKTEIAGEQLLFPQICTHKKYQNRDSQGTWVGDFKVIPHTLRWHKSPSLINSKVEAEYSKLLLDLKRSACDMGRRARLVLHQLCRTHLVSPFTKSVYVCVCVTYIHKGMHAHTK
jgi:hypothetical protein